ncbi:MAG: hypothetical protein HY684_05500 [Chloroflexi bacterium]|nr:hypothetical protein [Chloroflexota bacterium]
MTREGDLVGISIEDCEGMLREMVAAGGMAFAFEGKDAVCELLPREAAGLEVAEGWAMMKGPGGRFRLDMKAVEKVELAEEEGVGAPVSYSARFFDASGRCLLRASFPNPYLDDDGRPTGFVARRLALFEDFCRRYSGADGVEVRRLHRAHLGPERP